MQSAVQKVQSAAEALSTSEKIATTKVTGINTAFTATIDATAAASNYSVEVKQLAQGGERPEGTTRTLTFTLAGQKEPLTLTLSDD